MRKHQQKKILELLRTIEEAQSAGLLADCQDGALNVGEYIESLSGEGTQTVALLEEYCELLFKASGGEIGEKQLRRHLIKVENSAKYELKPDKIEVAFLPYNITMWDSLESIWLAAKDDPQCDAYVIPIPYYELLPNGSLGEMHYDGNLYPNTISIMDWQEYDVELRNPDIIFTHYPYDDNTSNASIHPDFYSKKLRQHCGLLVHVPYFVLISGDMPDYFAYLPGVLFAHKVIVQSEDVRKSYIDQYKVKDKESGLTIQFGKADEKFVALGSPKFDKVINSKRSDFDIPKEWQKLICRSDGLRKTVFLYNTHMFTWLDKGESYFDKLYIIFSEFRNRDDAVLWWRPHPNTELNFRTKRPHLLDAYYKITNEFKSESIGIYDDTPDLNRALACSDAYYGDWSSLIVLFGVLGKPIFIHNIQEKCCNAIDRYVTYSSNTIDDTYPNLNVFDFVTSEMSDKHLALSKDGTIAGQKEAFSSLTTFSDGSAGRHIYEYAKNLILS